MKTLNKILAAAVTVFTVSALSATAVYAANTPKFSLNETEAAAGEEVTLTFECSNNPGITAWKVEFDYDHNALELISLDSQGIFDDIIPSQTLDADPFVMSWSNDIKDVSVNGKIADINFKVKESAADGEYPIKITYDEDNIYSVVLDSNGIETNVHFDTQNGSIKVKHNHDYKLVSQKAATCTEAGKKVYQCSKCGDTKTETIKAPDHKYTETIVAPTASAQGYTLHTCSVCGHSYKDNYTEPTVSQQLVNNSQLSATSIKPGDTIKVIAAAEGGSGSYRYQVLYKQKAQTKWTTVQAYDENTTVTFKPASATEYDVCVKVKDSNGTEAKKYFTVSVTNQLRNISTISQTEIKLGETVTVNAAASGGDGGYKYAVYYKEKSESKWIAAQSFSRNAAITLTLPKIAAYDVCVKVKDSAENTEKLYFTVNVTVDYFESGPYYCKMNSNNTVQIVKYTGNAASVTIPATINDKQVTSIAGDAFIECTNLTSISVESGSTSFATDNGVLYSKDKTKLIYCPMAKEGRYIVLDTVKSIEDNAFRNCAKLTYIIINEGSLANIGSNAFSGCTGIASITIPDTVTSIGKDAFAGCTNLSVIYGLKDSYAETYAKANGIPFTALSSFLKNNSTTVSSITLGESFTVNAKAAGGTGGYHYAVYYKMQSSSKWTVSQTYDTNSQIIIKPKKAVPYDVCVKVKDSTGEIVKKYFTVKVNYNLVNISSISSDSVKVGGTLTIECDVIGNQNVCKYQVLYKQTSKSKWTVVQDYDANDIVTIKPSQAADYDICVKAQDKDGQLAKKYFTVTVTK